MNVRLTKEQKIQLLNSEDVYQVMQQVLLRENKIRRNQEHFWVVGLDNDNKILFIELISLGSVNRVQVNPPEVFRMAIYKLAVKVVLIHNHPSQNLKPSDDDIEFTDVMLKSGKIINLDVVDHLIISEQGYFSFADKGIMQLLSKNGRYKLIDKNKEDLKEWKVKIETEQVKKENSFDIAKKLMAEGMDNDFIIKVTGLTKWEIDEF